uniref:Transmembrane protein 254 n=1 Tax=Phallusia mammillata TaxID=59560 RepID=A0A6F9DUH3_9ASCI|nr:transmembrane protein 254-like [Phallusia mammillata]
MSLRLLQTSICPGQTHGTCWCSLPVTCLHSPLSYTGYISRALLIHFAEALYSIHLTSKYGITDNLTRFKWFVQTLLFGVFSF